jgi:dTDP-4-amino-4,6-dideoxygalactose transaminase
MNTKIWLSPPHMGGSEEKYVREAFSGNWIAPLGPNVDHFEKALSQYLGGYNVAVLSSGTAAIHLALVLLGVKQGDEILVSDFTFAATVNPILYQGAVPVFIDSELQTWNMDPELLEAAITDRIRKNTKPKAILLVDIYGMPANMEALLKISEKYNIPLIEDSAEALGSRYQGQPCGTFGEMGILSFNGNKIITTSAGGALVSANPDYISDAHFLACQARENTLHFQHSRVGYNYKMSNVLAGIGRGQMEVVEERVKSHRFNNHRYRELLSDVPGLIFQSEPDEKFFSNFWLTSLIISDSDEHFNAGTVINSLVHDNIDCRPLMKAMHLQPAFNKYPAYLSGNAEYLFTNGLSLPSGSSLTSEDASRIVGRIRAVRDEK